MSFAWWRRPEGRTRSPAPVIENEKRERQAELAQAVVTFERRRLSVHETAKQALQSMRENDK
ncbi:hypothetical protein ASG25_10560 [Rhizobium sp. Leaf384]|uniref:hypothetical protein n=1 Tax=Rhizobium sp. Leaf384 TaxID=1736358 RepID=UPI0007125BB5|nr:hypothetical protein [Rhizobium sp. Leaf384]KQS79022.1 hypothetical protein ASG25_10560 [Rhizobium sp. Leaf384]